MVGKQPSSRCRPVRNWSWAPWLLSVVHIERSTTISSTQVRRCGHQSLTGVPHCPPFLNPTWSGKRVALLLSMMLLATCSRTFLRNGEDRTPEYALWPIVLPAYLLSAGLGSKLSR